MLILNTGNCGFKKYWVLHFINFILLSAGAGTAVFTPYQQLAIPQARHRRRVGGGTTYQSW